MNKPFIRQPQTFEPRRPVTWGVRLGYFYGIGLSSIQVAHQLNEGATAAEDTTSDGTVRTMLQRAKVPPRDRRKVPLTLHLEEWERDVLQIRADERGCTVHQLMYRLIASGLVLDDLYDAVTDGRYDR